MTMDNPSFACKRLVLENKIGPKFLETAGHMGYHFQLPVEKYHKHCFSKDIYSLKGCSLATKWPGLCCAFFGI